MRLTGMHPEGADRTATRLLAPVAVAALVVAVVAGATVAIRTSHRSSQSAGTKAPLLRLTSGSGTPATPGPIRGGNFRRYVLAGPLPSVPPAAAPVYRFDPASAPLDSVRRLASALGLTGTPQHTPDGWHLRSGARQLTVQDGAGWPWQLIDLVEVSSPRLVHPSEPIDPVPGLHAPSTSSAEHAAATLLQALGLGAQDLLINEYGGVVEVRAPRRVDAKPAAGFDTHIVIGTGDRVRYGSGWLGHPGATGSYPLITAKEAFERLQAQSSPLMLSCCRAPGIASRAMTLTVTGARVGLMVATDEQGSLLVPAWLFA
ncbi:MAG: hypothetical protein ABJA34_11705, partial [Pseudonocardiales bacterium]